MSQIYGSQGETNMAKKIKFTTTIDVQTKESLDRMSEALGKPTNQLLDFIVENFYLRTWPRKYNTYLAKRKAELERILKLQQENV
nr:hypothetical protein HAGR004_01390 [Bdellovibrio sp. HAGR004]